MVLRGRCCALATTCGSQVGEVGSERRSPPPPSRARPPAKVEDTKAATRQPSCQQFTTTSPIARASLMSTPLLDVWEAAASSPFHPTVGKNTQFTFGILLLALCMRAIAGVGGAMLTVCSARPRHHFQSEYAHSPQSSDEPLSDLHRPELRQPPRPRCPGFVSIRVRSPLRHEAGASD